MMEDIDLQARLEENLIRDHAKHDISDKERCEIINRILKRHDISVAELGRRFGIPKTTLHYWMLWNKISDDEVSTLKSKGYSDADINRILRGMDGNSSIRKQIRDRVHDLHIDTELKAILKKLRAFHRHCPDTSPETLEILKDIVDTSNRIMIKIEKQRKQGRGSAYEG
jgi:hypothetical protein